ncbi:sensor histidine kinase [Kineosporia sp. A_224]|uniref:sensor histidine kinase n=1 Tax=Kineosporia sp. A_224 TaxID=1962180 RepID=UPI000B4B718A|nr:histidine kinase [Kineosporia sp. A_224]
MRDLLRSVWSEPRPAPPPRQPVGRDRLLVAVVVLLVGVEWVLRPDLPWRTFSAVLLVLLAPTLLLRRTRPLVAVAVAFWGSLLASAVSQGDGLQNYTAAALLLLPFALFRWGSGREIVLGSFVMLTKLAAAGALRFVDLLAGVAVLVAVSALGAASRYRASARVRILDRVRLAEREALARDLHDTVAHHVSAMAIRAQAGIATAPVRPEAAVEALHVIESEAARTLAELRSMVGVLRSNEPAALVPAPGLGDLPRLAEPDGAPRVDVVVAPDVGDLAPGVGAAVFRLAQEAVTNARRHARRPTVVEVRVSADGDVVHLRVHDDGAATPPRRPDGGGFGLVGMAERARLLGGTCAAGPDPAGGWTVTAVLPRPVTP